MTIAIKITRLAPLPSVTWIVDVPESATIAIVRLSLCFSQFLDSTGPHVCSAFMKRTSRLPSGFLGPDYSACAAELRDVRKLAFQNENDATFGTREREALETLLS